MITIGYRPLPPDRKCCRQSFFLVVACPRTDAARSRPVRWDSDHVTIMDDPTMDLFSEIVRCNALDRVHYGLDYFDASINRIGAIRYRQLRGSKMYGTRFIGTDCQTARI